MHYSYFLLQRGERGMGKSTPRQGYSISSSSRRKLRIIAKPRILFSPGLFYFKKGGNIMEVKEKKELEKLSREELLELIKELQKQVKYWKHRFNCVDKEYSLVCWQYQVPKI